MKILAISDEECPALWDYYIPGRLDEYDLIISCGDLKASYLSFLVTMGKAPVLYVHGNHDTSYEQFPPEGCDCIDGKFVIINGIRILGLGGSVQYREGAHQYTERQMRSRIRKLCWKIQRAGGVDIVVTHAPPKGLGDIDDWAHRGFYAFVELIEKYQPKYLLHGHIHLRYGSNLPRIVHYQNTQIINVCERYTIDIKQDISTENFRKRATSMHF